MGQDLNDLDIKQLCNLQEKMVDALTIIRERKVSFFLFFFWSILIFESIFLHEKKKPVYYKYCHNLAELIMIKFCCSIM